jgi:hypothetical protein
LVQSTAINYSIWCQVISHKANGGFSIFEISKNEGVHSSLSAQNPTDPELYSFPNPKWYAFGKSEIILIEKED